MRGQNVELTREIPTLASVVLAIRWDAGSEPALDAGLAGVVLLCDRQSRVLSDEHMVFFNQLVTPDLSVGQRAEASGGDKEQVEVDLRDVPPEVERVVVAVYLNEGAAVRRTLGRLRSCSVRVLDLSGDRELVHSQDLAATLTEETALVLAELYRHATGWKFRVVGQGYQDGLRGVARDYGVPL